MGNKVLLPVHPHFTGINQVNYLYQHPMVSKLSILAGTSLVFFFCGYFFYVRGKHMQLLDISRLLFLLDVWKQLKREPASKTSA